jgi:alpha-L-fucosidase 2
MNKIPDNLCAFNNPLLNWHLINFLQEMKNTILFYLVTYLFFSCTTTGLNNDNSESEEDVLWFDEPAAQWEEALPLGNGRIGVMVFGGTSTEHIQLNDDSMWPGDDGWVEPDGNPDDLKRIRQLLFEGEHVLADSLFVEKFSNKTVVRSHQTLGDLHIDLGHKSITDYKRELNISKGISTVSYKSDGMLIKERAFVSHPHQAIFIEIISESKQGLNGHVRLSRREDNGHPTVSVKTTEDNHLIMNGEVTQYGGKFRTEPAPITKGVVFETRLKINNEGGEVKRGKDYLELNNVKRAVFKVVSNSSFYCDDPAVRNKEQLIALEGKSIDQLLKLHIKDHQELYDRVKFKLSHENLDNIPTDERIEVVKQGQQDPGLETLLFQYGRYLLIASSRPGTNPANLQGLWNQHIEAPWNADYHLNINLQMNYWLADVTNLSELNKPLFDYVDKLIENGKNTAEVNFGCNGSFLPHATDLWAPTWLRAPTAYWGCSLGAGGWMVQHYWEHFAFSQDMEFLKERAFPAIHEVAQFYSDWIITDPRDGTLISAPSTSPENRYINSRDERVATCLGSAMDQQVIAEVFDNYIKTCSVLKIENDLLEKIKVQRSQLRPGFVLGSDGRILEWDREYVEMEPGHRHMSHLYGFHPGTSITEHGTPEIFKAVRKTLDYRLDHGGAGTGWSRAWLINCAARLLDGEMAHEHIQLLFQKSIFKNLFDAHPPFQIDGNFGYTAGIAEMLLQSHEEGKLRLLPALPSAWESGNVTGLKARGGYIVDLYWNNGSLEQAVIKAEKGGSINIVFKDKIIPLTLEEGKSFTFRPE